MAEPKEQIKKYNIYNGKTDLSLTFGIVFSIIIFMTVISLSGSIAIFLNIPSLALVFGCSVSLSMASTSGYAVISALRESLYIFIGRKQKVAKTVALQIIELSKYSNEYGAITLAESNFNPKSFSFLQNAIDLIIKGNNSEEIKNILFNEAQKRIKIASSSINSLQKMADYAPAMGLIGTLIGLIKMLVDLTDPSTMGINMAMALLTTFYGSVLANLFFTPLSNKLEQRLNNEIIINELVIGGAISIVNYEKPEELGRLFNSVLPSDSKLVEYL